jgi:cobaltochelatase CobN
MRKKTIYILIAAAVIIFIVWFSYSRYISPTRIATLNFPDFTVEKFIRSNNNPFVKIKSIDLGKASDISKYDMVLVRIHGSSMDKTHLDAIRKAIGKNVPVFSTESSNPEINSLTGRELEYISTLMENGSVKNYQSLFNYIRKKIDKKITFNKEYDEPVLIPDDYFFHLGEDEFFNDYETYQQFYETSGKYQAGAPRVVLLSGNINMQNSNEEHMAALINSLEEKGLNVYPVNSFGMKKLGMIAAVRPNIIINRPHGRLVMGGGESGTQLLKQLNVPIFAPVTISELYDTWLTDKKGMASGSMTSMSVVMPELDGAIVPFAIAAQFERNEMRLFDAIPVHTEKFCSMVKNFTTLQTKQNKNKKIAVYYYKGTGKGAVSAADIEGVQSLYNTLVMLQKNGYHVEGLPANANELEQMIQKQGPVLGAYALGAYDEFLKNGNLALVPVEQFNTWAENILPEKLITDLHTQYGEPPGEYMGVEKDEKKYIAVARLSFGNVTILPQPMPSVGDDIEKIIHGVDGAPAYPYVASYLWTREEFGADAIIHFGTHGSLEFIPGKQVALSDYDWTDALIGDIPHFYIYTINNIGEGIIAKRRSYATLISHLTAPFMQSELYNDLIVLKDRIQKIGQMDESSIKEHYRETITSLAKSQHILSALSIDSTRTLDDNAIQRIHMYLEEIDGAKVTDGLYTLGEKYSDENISNTARLISVDPVRYALAGIDAAQGKIKTGQLDNLVFISERYGKKTERIIARIMKGEDPDKVFTELVSAEDIALLEKEKKKEEMKSMQMQEMMKKMATTPKKEVTPFLDSEGNIIEKRTVSIPSPAKPDESMMARMAQAKTESMPETGENTNAELLTALQALQDALKNITHMQENLRKSTAMEQQALLNALNGGYVHPGSAGDPIVNPEAIPTGKNFYSINPEATPSAEAWKVGKRLAENLLEAELKTKGSYPEKISFTLWSTDFISSEGATIAQILYLLGVEPLRDGFGYIRSLRLIPAEKLGRPRIDVVVQTSGQLRDIAASRLELINRAVAMAAEDNSGQNFVRKGFEDAERLLLDKGYSPVDARKYSKERIFGGVNGNYGTGIMGMVEKGDRWDSTGQIAMQYIKNMGALYSANGEESWGEIREGVFEAALLNTSVVVQPRSSNTWGALSLDHVYEFMGGMSSAVQHVTGNDPTAYFNDFRNSSRAKVQELKEAIGVETNSTLFNPKYIREKLKGEASSMNYFAEVFRNTYGWNSMKPSAIDQHIWDQYYDIYVKDNYNLGVRKIFENKNPYALQEMTAVIMESARKGMWKATDEQLKEVASLHAELLQDHTAGCSGFICDNAKLKDFISLNLNDGQLSAQYQNAITAAREVRLEGVETGIDKNVVLKKDEQSSPQTHSGPQHLQKKDYSLFWIFGIIVLLAAIWLLIKRKKK